MADDMTPPGKKAATKKAPAKKAADKNESGEKKPRAPRKDRGIRPGAVITVTDKEPKLRGQRAEWYERVKAANGKTVREFKEANQGVTNKQGNPEPPHGWLSFMIDNGFVTVAGGEEEEKAEAKD